MLHDQVVSGLLNVTSAEIHDIVIAYEPVWAIGTGEVPTPRDLDHAVKAIRKQVKSLYGDKAEAALRVIYGGSVSADNCSSFLSVAGVNGLLPGGSSLNPAEFALIVENAHTNDKKKS